jgi:uncharacterized coiled-coil DUF342 family protein
MPWSIVITSIGLPLLVTVVAVGLGLFVRRAPLKTSNDLLRATVGDYKSRMDALTDEIEELKNQAIEHTKEIDKGRKDLDESKARELKLLQAVGNLTLENQKFRDENKDLTARIQALEDRLNGPAAKSRPRRTRTTQTTQGVTQTP